MSYTSIPTPTAAGDPLSTDKCCCGHPRSEHKADPNDRRKRPRMTCVSCASSVLINGDHPFSSRVVCEHFTKSYRIIDTDNFGGDYPDEKFIASGITYKPYADTMCEALNAKGGPHAQRWYRVVEDDYELQPGFEP